MERGEVAAVIVIVHGARAADGQRAVHTQRPCQIVPAFAGHGGGFLLRRAADGTGVGLFTQRNDFAFVPCMTDRRDHGGELRAAFDTDRFALAHCFTACRRYDRLHPFMCTDRPKLRDEIRDNRIRIRTLDIHTAGLLCHLLQQRAGGTCHNCVNHNGPVQQDGIDGRRLHAVFGRHENVVIGPDAPQRPGYEIRRIIGVRLRVQRAVVAHHNGNPEAVFGFPPGQLLQSVDQPGIYGFPRIAAIAQRQSVDAVLNGRWVGGKVHLNVIGVII